MSSKLSYSILNHFRITAKNTSLIEADEVLSQNFNHVVVISIDGLGLNVLEKSLSHKDFLRRQILADYSLEDSKAEGDEENITFEEITDQINKKGSAKAKYIVSSVKEDASKKEIDAAFDNLLSEIRKSCKTDDKTFTYVNWKNLYNLVQKEGSNSLNVAKYVQKLNGKLAVLCEELKGSVVFITSEKLYTEKQEDETNIPLIWYENKQHKGGLFIYYAVLAIIILLVILILYK